MNLILDLIVFGLFVVGLAQGARRRHVMLRATKPSEYRRHTSRIGTRHGPSW